MRLQPIENLSKTYSGDPHLDQTKLNGLLPFTIHGVLVQSVWKYSDTIYVFIAQQILTSQ